MSEQSPTLPQWKALYEQALQFKRLACWTWMIEENLFGIQDPKTGEIGYCCVIGSLGEVFGLIVYLGSEGLEGFRKLRAKRRPPGSIEGLLLHNCLSLTFDDRKYVHKEEHEIIKQLGLSLRKMFVYASKSKGHFSTLPRAANISSGPPSLMATHSPGAIAGRSRHRSNRNRYQSISMNSGFKDLNHGN